MYDGGALSTRCFNGIMMTTRVTEQEAEDQRSPHGSIDFAFLPKALVEKCKPFIIRYHELNGFSTLPDILWHPETHQVIEADLALSELFRRSSSSRGAKKANEGLILIATLILSTEILAIGLAGWATRYPAARRKARALLAEHMPSSFGKFGQLGPARLTERYLYLPIERSYTVLRVLAPSRH